MAFPVREGSNSGANTTGGTTHTINLPDGIQPGEDVYVFFFVPSGAVLGGTTGWTEVITATNETFSRDTAIYHRIIDGTEGFDGTGDTLPWTTDVSRRSFHYTLRISGHDSATRAPVALSATDTTATDPDPPSLDPTGAADDTLWIAVCHNIDAAATYTPPTDFTELFEGNNTQNQSGSVAARELNAGSLDPGTFTASSKDDWAAILMAIRPAAAGTVDSGEAEPEPSSGGSWGYYSNVDRYRTPAELLRVRRARERAELDLTESEQRKIDRTARKIARSLPNVGLAAPQAIMIAPAFDQLLMALQPSEGQIQALVQAILDRLAFVEAERDEEAQLILALMMEL